MCWKGQRLLYASCNTVKVADYSKLKWKTEINPTNFVIRVRMLNSILWMGFFTVLHLLTLWNAVKVEGAVSPLYEWLSPGAGSVWLHRRLANALQETGKPWLKWANAECCLHSTLWERAVFKDKAGHCLAESGEGMFDRRNVPSSVVWPCGSRCLYCGWLESPM